MKLHQPRCSIAWVLGPCSSANSCCQPVHPPAHALSLSWLAADLLAEPEQRAGSFLDKGNQSWQKVLQVDLWAVCVGAQLAAHHMAQHSTQGV